MHRSIRPSVAVLAVACTAAAPLAAQAAPTTIRLSDTQTFFHEYDRAPKGPSASDVILMRATVHDAAGKTVGRDSVRCTGDRRCVATFVLADGTLRAAGRQTGSVFPVAIVGGTGRYAGARGTIRVALGAHGSRFVVRLR